MVLPFYIVGTAIMRTLLLTLTRWRVVGRENVPKNGPVIIVANHLSLADPPLLSASIPRQIVFMAKKELFRSPGGAFVRAFGAFPVRRGARDREALRQAMRTLGSGQVLGMFPEGKRSLNHALGKAEPGIALIALRSGAPILPVGISGTESIKGAGFILHRPRIIVTIGHPFHLPERKGKLSREQLMNATDFIMRHIAKVLPQSYRGAYVESQLSSEKSQTGVTNGD